MAKSISLASDCASVLARFPEDASLVVELAAAGEIFCVLCEEHGLATQAVQRPKETGGDYDEVFYEYLAIIRDLEHEIATAIANEKRSFHRSGAAAGSLHLRDASMP